MTIGRPTVYTDQMVVTAREYIQNFKNYGDMIPSNVGLCRILGVRRQTLYAWKDDPTKKEFSDMLDELQEAQKRTLINNGLSGSYNAAITKLVLTKHGYSDKADNTLSNPDGSGIFNSMKITFVEAKQTDE